MAADGGADGHGDNGNGDARAAVAAAAPPLTQFAA